MQKSYKMGGLGTHSIASLKPGIHDGKFAGLYDLEETLGRGHFAVVKLARHVFTGEKVAVKVIDKSKLDSVSKAHLFQEVRCMKLVQHPNVVRLYEVIDTATKLYLILELGDGGDLYDYIMRHEAGLNEALARDYFAQIVRAITYCHQLHVVHRDLKPENVVFFEKQGVVKLTDFGFSNKFSPGQKLETSCGSLAYSAPEILLGDSYDAPAVDVWSLGVILYMLVCGQAPFHEANDSETLTMIMDCKYTVPVHISHECKDLIARMLVRAPDKRATLSEIAAHPWFARTRCESVDMPLVSREQLKEEDHNTIVQKMVNGTIATKEEIQECLDKNDYNHITATYFLLAERKLRLKRQEQIGKTGKRPENLVVPNNNAQQAKLLLPAPACLLSVPRTPGDVPQRSRKCSIVQEDEEEEDISSSGREDLSGGHNSLNRRGSRSEGRINIALQERLAEAERRKEEKQPRVKAICNIKMLESRPRSAHESIDVKLAAAVTASKWKAEKAQSIPETTHPVVADIPTTIITQASTITVPITQNTSRIPSPLMKYKTMPAAAPPPQIQLNEIFEEGDAMNRPAGGNRQMVNRSRYTEHRRTKFHKSRTASCSSSDASDDDSENRKKRAHKMNTNTSTAKPLQPRRDSHDDSSDSQEPGANGATTRNPQHGGGFNVQSNNDNSNNNKGTNGNETTGGRKHTNSNTPNGAMLGRRHKASRRRSTETRLRESQSLNRITEEQDGSNNATANLIVQTSSTQVSPKPKGFGAKLFGFTMGGGGGACGKRPATEHYSRKDKEKPPVEEAVKTEGRDEKENKLSSKKMRLLGRYLQVHKRIFMPIPNLFSRNKLYKARSCGSLTRDKITTNPGEVEALRARAVSVIRNSVGSTSDINQNMGATKEASDDANNVVLVKSVTVGLSNMCAHLAPASKCSFC